MVAFGLAAGCTADSSASDSSASDSATSDSATSGSSKSLSGGPGSASSGAPGPAAAASPAPVPPTGAHQAGITLPQPAQSNLLAVVADLTASAEAGPLLAELGTTVRALADGSDARLLGLPPGDLTVTIGVGPRLVRMAGRSLPGTTDLPGSPASGSPPRHAAVTC